MPVDHPEKPEAATGPDDDWRAYLAEHAIGDQDALDLSRGRMVGLATRAALVLRRMVGTAADSAPPARLRTRALHAIGRVLNRIAHLLFLPMLFLRRLARRTERR